MRTAKTVTSLGECPGWSESSLGAHSFCWFCHVAAHIGYFQQKRFDITAESVEFINCYGLDLHMNQLIQSQTLLQLWVV